MPISYACSAGPLPGPGKDEKSTNTDESRVNQGEKWQIDDHYPQQLSLAWDEGNQIDCIIFQLSSSDWFFHGLILLK